MTIETDNEADADDQGIDANADWLLCDLVAMANQFEAQSGIPITITIGGSIVSGLLISGKVYFSEYAKFWSLNFEGEEKERIEAYFGRHASIYDSTDAEDGDALPPTYLHLRGARYFSGNANPIPVNEGLLWRGKIASVDGFSLGTFVAKEEY